MAETFLGPVIEKLVDLLAEQVSSLKGVHKEVNNLKDELEIIQPFLKDAEAKLAKGEVGDATKVWLKQMRELADRIEDVVDEYQYHLAERSYPKPGFINSLRRAGVSIRSLKPRYDIASEILDINESMEKIKGRGVSYGLRPFEQGSSSSAVANGDASVVDPRFGSLFIEEDELVGIDSTSEELIRSLVEGSSTRSVISLVGEAGIGKTTLARKVYNTEAVKKHFEFCAWITVSQSYNIEKVLKIMKNQICPAKEEPVGTIEALTDLLRQYLETKRYVVVFDDVWQFKFWEDIKHTLPSSNQGNRIIITTRNTSIANMIANTTCDVVRNLKAWSPELAWELFCKKAFPFESCPQELKQLSDEIIRKCQGLPLVIAVVAGLLSTKEKTKVEWQRVLDNLSYEFRKNPQLSNVSKVISFSCHDLPYHLNSCSLYFRLVIERLVDLLVEEVTSSKGVPREVMSMKDELEFFQPFLKDAEAKLAKGEVGDVTKVWLKQLREVADRIEDVVAEYRYHLGERRNHERGFVDSFRRFGDSISSSRLVYDIASEIRDINESLQKIKGRGVIYGLRPFEQGSSRSAVENVDASVVDPRLGYLFIDEDELVGIDSSSEELIKRLVEGPSTRSVISLVGEGGIGKTTLASIVYQNEEMRRHFDFVAWIRVSKSYDFKELLRSLTTQISSAAGDCIDREIDTMELQEPRLHLGEYLSIKRYLIVFDDVWETDFWEKMNHVLPNNNKSSRIVITTRNNAIAYSCDIVQNLQPLSEDRALELFCKRAFSFEFEGRPLPELEELSIEFVRRCYGLPLVITTVADFLSKQEKVVSEWKKLLHQFNDEFEKIPFFSRLATVIFSPTYDDIPFHIRPCLLYFGIILKDSLFSDVKLFKLWIAEGFVQETYHMSLEQVAATYLNELINRNLVQVSYVNYYGTERMCRVSGFMHDIILAISKDDGFCQNWNERSSRIESPRLSIFGDKKDFVESIEISKVRSVLFYGLNEPMRTSYVVTLFKRSKLLVLLDFENAPLYNLPNEVGNLLLLKYLSLRNTKVKKLPKSIGLLLNLQTLDCRNTLMRELPNHILKLRKLRHLLASAYNDGITSNSIHGVRIKKGIGCLENLRTLLTVQAHRTGFDVMEELKNLRQLRWLSISKLTAAIVNSLCATIEKMNHLESLSLYSSSDYQNFDLESISSPPSSLRRLILTCRLEKLPDWISRLHNLSVLALSFSRLAVDPLKAIHDLPNLVSLWLHRAYIGEQLHFEEASFQKLKQLVLTELYDLRMMRIEKGALPLLEELRIGPTSDEFSFDIQHLRDLQVLECYDMPEKFVLRLQPEGGSDYWKVKHVPSVVFRYRVRGRRYVSYKLGDPGLLAYVKGLCRTTNVELHDRPLSFFYMDDEELASTSSARWSEQGSFISDDIED